MDLDLGGPNMDPRDLDPDLQNCLAVTVDSVERCQILECINDLLLKVLMQRC
jgi:hypothetical protein